MKKGFTLIELLGVLVVLGILAIITVPLVFHFINGARDDSRQLQEQNFVKAAKNWAGDNVFSLPTVGNSSNLTLEDLIEGGYLETIPEGYDESDCIKIRNDNNRYKYSFSDNCN